MSQRTDSPSVEVEDVQNPILDANEALKNGEYRAAFSKLKQAERRCGVLVREGDDGDD